MGICNRADCEVMRLPEYCDVCGDYTLYRRDDDSDIYDCSECGRAVQKYVQWLAVEETPEEKPA